MILLYDVAVDYEYISPSDRGFWVGCMLAKRTWLLCMPSGYGFVSSLRDFCKVFCFYCPRQ